MVKRERDRWWFYQGETRMWRWEHHDPKGQVLSASDYRFPTRADCVEDARQNGYIPDRTRTPVRRYDIRI